MKPVRLTAPAPLLTLAEAKQHLRVDASEDDARIARLCVGETEYLDGYSGILGRCLVNQTWRLPVQEWSSVIRLPFTNVSGVSVKYRDVANDEQTVSASNYDVVEDHLSPAVVFKGAFAWPELADSESPISIDFTAGYGVAADVPDRIKTAVLERVKFVYDELNGKENATLILDAIDQSISGYRLRRV
jgi:uncharacterized phiE125 gp8 family phage protein